jgi:hypothetical protein
MAVNEQARRYNKWEKYLYEDWEPSRDGISKCALLAYLRALTRTGGNFGICCFRSNTNIAREIGLSRRQAIRCRKVALAQGVIRLTGEHRGRVKVVAIAFPGERCSRCQRWAEADECVCGWKRSWD